MVPDFEPGKNAKYPRNTLLCAPSPSHIYPLDSAKIDFYELKKVQILRFVELCEQYGYREGNTREMAPIDEWETGDREELAEPLEIAASARLWRLPTPSHPASRGTG